ncbi:MAG: hypothetical protein RO009_20810 [Pseudorhodoplanes sp.]|nr:hypothetical protein [Pseudorhodoplanes sp.]
MTHEPGETTATGKWTQPGVPHRGWHCVDIEELEEQDHLCEMCEARYVRFVHVMEHPNYPDTLRVGCVCAGHMEENLVGARKREAGFKSERSRRVRWLSRRWRVSAAGNEFLNTNDGFNVVVYPRGAIWGARVEHRASGYQRTSKRPYKSADEAKLAAFDAMTGMKHSEPWRRR